MLAAPLLLLLGVLPPADRAVYEAAEARAGRDADAHVALALWCEAHGLEAERIKHLAIAAIVDPRHALARGLMGLVEYRGRWQRPEAVGEAAGADAVLAEYRRRRDVAANTADAQWALALWCEEAGLDAEAAAHFRTVVSLDPGRDAAWKRLGYKRQGKRWVTDVQLAEEKAEAERQKQADRHWKPLLEKWRERLASKTKRAEAEQALAEVTDPRAVPMVWATFGMGKPAHQAVAVRVLGQIDDRGASRALAMLAVFGGSAEVRRTATETLRRRDAREFADLLVGLVRDPIKYEVKPVGGPGSPGELYIQGENANVKRRYAPPAGPDLNIYPGDRVGFDNNGLPVVRRYLGAIGQITLAPTLPAVRPSPPHGFSPVQERQFLNFMANSGLGHDGQRVGQMILDAGRRSAAYSPIGYLANPDLYDDARAEWWSVMTSRPASKMDITVGRDVVMPVGQMEIEAQKAAAAAQQQLQNDAQALERQNEPIKRLNERVLPVLREVAGQDIGESRKDWDAWWVDLIGFRIMPQKASDKPTITEDVPLDYVPQTPNIAVIDRPVSVRRMSCFGAGTLVRTLSGPRPIESLKVGDRVLTQDTATGALRYQPIVVVHHNPPSKTLRIALGDETVVSSLFHRFWKAGRGWVMARDLTPGDTVRTLGGLARVGTIDEGEVQPVFNLDVADDADFFVGRQGALVHDNTLPDLRLPPFDAGPALAAATPATPAR